MSWCLIHLLLFTFILFNLADAKTCYFKEGSSINAICDVSASRSTSVLWQISEHNITRTLFNCTMLTCKKVDGSNIWLNDSDIMLLATSYLDLENSYIRSSSLNGPVASININSLTSLRNLQCQTDNLSIDVCEQIEIYTDPKNVTCSIINIKIETIHIQCFVYPVRSTGIVDKPFTIRNNVSTFNSSIIEKDLTIVSNEQNDKTECDYILYLKKMVADDYQFILVVSANVSDPDKALVKSNSVDISLSEDIKYAVCLNPDVDKRFFGLYLVKCYAPLPIIGKVMCRFNLKTNGTIIGSTSSLKLLLKQNNLTTSAGQCMFFYNLKKIGPGEHQFQVEMSKNTSDGRMIYKTSNWTSPYILRPQSQMNFTVNGSPDGAVVSLNDNVSFHCTTDGIPLPPRKIIGPMGYFRSTLEYLDGTDTSLPFTSCKDAGNYSCTGEEVYGWGKIAKQVSVKILCPQRLRLDYFQNQQYFGDFINTTTVDIPLIGYPSPRTMTLFRQQYLNKTLITEGVSITYKEDNVSPYGKIIVNFINKGLISEMTKFTLRVNNGIGDDTLFDFFIQGNGTSISPVNQSTRVSSIGSATLVEGIDGGLLIPVIILLHYLS